jgi:hypothetical protein
VETVVELFATSPTAPPYEIQEGRVLVRLDELAVPWVYGVGMAGNERVYLV